MSELKTPVLFLVFNRPEETERALDRIRQARPGRLYVAADGPRPDRSGEGDVCGQVRDIATRVDWDCELKTLFRKDNLGCRKAVSSALDWFFENEEEGIILEDDCLASRSFFPFCQELLDRYRDDNRIMVVSGNNFQFGRRRTDNSYYFSRYNHCWGWATWRRAWLLYDADLRHWPRVRDEGYLEDILSHPSLVSYWTRIFDIAYRDEVDSWAYRWTFTCWIQNGLSILPGVNLVSNIGFGDAGTHTRGDHPVANLPTEDLTFPLKHPMEMIRDDRADWHTHTLLFEPKVREGLIRRIRKMLG
jgi:hypothetical protein